MALTDTATLVIGTAHYFVATTGTAKPTDAKNPGASWEEIGHTDLESILTMETEGGERRVLGTLQKKTLRTTTSSQTDSFSLTLQQWDEAGLKLYYGSNATVGPDGAVRVPSKPEPTEKAFYAVFWDGDQYVDLYAAKSEISRAETIDFADTENLAGLPLSIQPLEDGSNEWGYEVGPVQTYVAP